MQVFYDGVKRISIMGAAALFAATNIGVNLVQARPLTPAETREYSYDGKIPACADPDVLSRIQSRFGQAEDEYWHSGLQIVGFDRAEEIGFRSNGADYIPRRYCVAQAMMNDQKVRTVSYSVGENLGLIGFWGFGVDWCVAGLDREKAYAPNCKMARP